MFTIYKYEVQLTDYFTIMLPIGAEVLSVGVQNELPYMWVLVNTKNPPLHRHFRLVGTGHPIQHSEDSLHFCGTFQLHGGSLIFHLFEII